MADCAWKPNWEETRQHFVDWWAGDGMAVGSWGAVRVQEPIEPVEDPGGPDQFAGKAESMTSAAWRPLSNHWTLAHSRFPEDCLPIGRVDLGPGSLALFIGSEPGFDSRTVWYHPCFEDVEEPEKLPPLEFDPGNHWWKVTEDLVAAQQELAEGRYMVGCPDLIENVDTLASLRGTEKLLLDMMDRPDWVLEKLYEINQVWFEAYERIHNIVALEDGSSAFSAFAIWGPGKTAKVQCDASAMLGPDMFARFVAPPLAEQCEWLDHSIFHLDGHECIPHLDHLLAIDALGAIEWTPDPNVPPGGNPEWYEMYRRIKDAGKSVQAIGVKHEEIAPLLDAVGPEGMYILTDFAAPEDAEKVSRIVEAYR